MSRFEAEQTNSLAPLAAAEGQEGRPNRAVVPCRPTLDAVAHSSCQLSTRFRLNPCILGSTLPKSFLGTDTPKTRALATPDACEGVPVPPWWGITRLYCAHTRGSNALRLQSAFLLAFWHFFVAFLYDFFCIHSTFADGVWLAFAAMRLIVRCPRRIVAPFFVAGGGGVRQPRRGQAAPCAQGCTDTTQVPILQLLAQ